MVDKNESVASYRQLVDDATKLLYETSDTPRIDAEVLMQHVLRNSLSWLIAHGDNPSTNKHTEIFSDLIKQRKQGHPIAYLVGYKEFWSLKLKVNKHVLIPRADTETLVDQALERLNESFDCKVLDLGTGSGAIGLAIAKERPLATVLAVDSQPNAITLAKENAETAKLSNVCFLLSNWFKQISNEKFDLIASNPPYVHPEDAHLNKKDLRFEPNVALIGGNDGLAEIRKIVSDAPRFLYHQGWLLIEHGYDQKTDVSALFKQAGFKKIKTYEDLNKLPRCTTGQWIKSP